jgi:hypothetical protein
MTKKNIMVWGFLFAGVLMVTAGLRDLFAPGFASISPRIPTTGDVVGDFVTAAAFFAVAAFSRTRYLDHARKSKLDTKPVA